MSEKKNSFMQSEMRPLSALRKGSEAPPVKEKRTKRTAPARVPVPQNNIGNTVMSLTGQNKVTDTSTMQRTPFRAVNRMQKVREQVNPEPVPAMHREADETERIPAPPVVKEMPERSRMHSIGMEDVPETMHGYRTEPEMPIQPEPLYEVQPEPDTENEEPEVFYEPEPETAEDPVSEPEIPEKMISETEYDEEIILEDEPELLYESMNKPVYEPKSPEYDNDPESFVQSIQREIQMSHGYEPEPVFEKRSVYPERTPRPEGYNVYEEVSAPKQESVSYRKRAVAPDLSNKAERDEFFSKYTNKPSHRHVRPTAALKNKKEQSESVLPEHKESGNKRENPFLKRENPFLRNNKKQESISHAAEEEQQETETSEQIRQPAVENVRPEMREVIEGVVRMQRLERESAAEMEKEAVRGSKRFHTIRGIAIMGVTILTGVFMLAGEKPVYSPQENRAIAKMPEFSVQSLMRSEYTHGISGYFNDAVPMRSVFKKAVSVMSNLKGLPEFDKNETAFYGSAAEMGEAPEKALEIGESVIINNLRAMSLYSGSQGGEERYAELINEFTKSLPDTAVYSMVAPTAVSFYLPEKYQKYSASEKESIDKINILLSDAVPVDVYPILAEHKEEEIYARTDHHWTSLGAYYACEAFVKAAETDFTYKTNLTANTFSGYVGSMYTMTGSKVLSNNPENFEYFIAPGRYSTEYYDTSFRFMDHGKLIGSVADHSPVNYYSVFLDGNNNIVHVTTEAGNDRTLVVFKDSFANAMIPCLTTSFSDIYVCDITTFELNAHDFCKETGATDVLFAVSTFSAAGENLDCLEDIITDNAE